MRDEIKESDWKRFKKIQPVALERLSERILGKVAELVADSDKSFHERYLAVYRAIKDGDEDVARGFDKFSRSSAVFQLAVMRGQELVTDEELVEFSEETQESVEGCVKMMSKGFA